MHYNFEVWVSTSINKISVWSLMLCVLSNGGVFQVRAKMVGLYRSMCGRWKVEEEETTASQVTYATYPPNLPPTHPCILPPFFLPSLLYLRYLSIHPPTHASSFLPSFLHLRYLSTHPLTHPCILPFFFLPSFTSPPHHLLSFSTCVTLVIRKEFDPWTLKSLILKLSHSLSVFFTSLLALPHSSFFYPFLTSFLFLLLLLLLLGSPSYLPISLPVNMYTEFYRQLLWLWEYWQPKNHWGIDS